MYDHCSTSYPLSCAMRENVAFDCQGIRFVAHSLCDIFVWLSAVEYYSKVAEENKIDIQTHGKLVGLFPFAVWLHSYRRRQK